MAESVSQTEYDVTAYRNVLDQLNTVEGELDKLRNYLRADIALSFTDMDEYKYRRKLSGWAMEHYGGKDPYRWSRVLMKKIGASGVRNSKGIYWYHNPLRKWAERIAGEPIEWNGKCTERGRRGLSAGRHRQNEIVCKHRTWIGSYAHRVTPKFFDVHNLIRNVNWELNRLRIEMPFDLRQLTNQMNEWAGSLQMIRGEPKAAIREVLLFEKVEELRKNIIPKMKQKLKKKIEEAKLAEKVAAEQMRRENEETITKEKRRKQQENDAIKRLENAGAKVARSNGNFIIVAGSNALTVQRGDLMNIAREMESAQKTVQKMRAKKEKATKPETDMDIQRENEKELQQREERSPVPALGVLALLALLGQG